MAKGVEDTAFYRYFPLLSLDEVGRDPLHGVSTIEDFHRHNLLLQAAWPRSLTGTSTHDTKRSEDARRGTMCSRKSRTCGAKRSIAGRV